MLRGLSFHYIKFWFSLVGRRFDRSLDVFGLSRVGHKRKFTPINRKNEHKFGGKNSFFGNTSSPLLANIPNTPTNIDIANNLKKSMGMALADGSWGKYQTAFNHLMRVQQETGVQMKLPLCDDQILWYISYLDTVRKIDVKTIEGYISGLRMLHLRSLYCSHFS